MQTVIETPAYLAAAKEAGLGEAERMHIVNHMAANPGDGEVIKGTGGARKLRFGGRGKGKSGGYRVITFFAAADIPVFLLDVYGKGSRADLSQAERNELRKLLGGLPDVWRSAAAARLAARRKK